MSQRTRVPARIAGLMLILLAGAGRARAADHASAIKQLTTLNESALEDYSAGDFDKAKGRLMQAVALGKKDPELRTHPLMARTFLNLGALYVDGFEDRKTGVGYFTKALKIQPNIELSESLVTKSVSSALAEAKTETKNAETKNAETKNAETKNAETRKESVAGAPATAASSPVTEPQKSEAKKNEAKNDAKNDAKNEPKSTLLAATEKQQQDTAAELQRQKERADKADKDTQATAERAAAEKQRLQQGFDKELALAKASEAKERAAHEKLLSDKQGTDKALADTRLQLQQLQKDKADKEKQLADTAEREKKERDAKEKLLAEKQGLEKSLAEAKAQLQQLQKDKADKERQLADTTEREKKERDAKEKLLAEKAAADTQDKEHKARDEAQRLQRERLVAGPDLPSHFNEPVLCNVPDEARVGTELFVHCVAKPGLAAKSIAFYYRSNTGTHFNSVELEPTKKGWRMAVVPANRVSGKALQYYAEALDSRGAVVAATGKAGSPNILALRPAEPSSPLKSASFIKKRP